MAKAEGVDIPDDLEKRLERFEENDGTKKGKGGDAKVHPEKATFDRRAQRSVTRYMPQASNVSANSNHKLIKGQDSMRNNEPMTSPFGNQGSTMINTSAINGGVINQDLEDSIRRSDDLLKEEMVNEFYMESLGNQNYTVIK